MLNVCICGGGGLGHVISGVLAESGKYKVSLFTGHPDLWGNEIAVTLPDNKSIVGRIAEISDKPSEVIADADYIIFCLPGYLIAGTLRRIRPFLKKGAVVGSVVGSSGFFWMAYAILPKGTPYWALQRVPYIARVIQYGQTAELKGYKNQLKVAVSDAPCKEAICSAVEEFFGTPTVTLDSVWAAALSNSNPLLHTCRLYTLFKNCPPNTIYAERPLFYEDWDDESSKLLIACDAEFQETLRHLPVKTEDIPPLLSYYESRDAESLTSKLRSITAFKGIRLDMIKVPGGYVPDWQNRYFTEDIPFGLLIIKSVAHYFDIATPSIDKVLYWAQQRMGKVYLTEGAPTGRDISDSGIPQNFLSSITDLL